VLSTKVVTVFVPADSKKRSAESVIELTVPIEAEATACPVAIVTSELASGTPTGLQLSASAQSELAAPVHVDLLMMPLPDLIAMPCAAKGAGRGREVLSYAWPETAAIVLAFTTM
jgi:hypothetical protein